MTVIGTIRCDRCSATAEVPRSGGYPQDWGAITLKSSRPPDTYAMSNFRDKRRWQHVCPQCSAALQEFLNELREADPDHGAMSEFAPGVQEFKPQT